MATGARVVPTSDTRGATAAPDCPPGRAPVADVRSALVAGGPAAFVALQRSAGNRAVGALLARRETRSLARFGNGRCSCGGACRTNGLEEEDERRAGRAAPARLQRSVTAAAPSCPALPDAMGEWRTQTWLCEMRKASIGDNTYTLATKGQRGAKGDARGRSVELVHQVLAHWLCHRPDVAARVTTPTGDRYTAASAAAVAEFQADFGEPASEIDGIVGPSTLNLLDYYIHGGPISSPAECGAPGPEPARPAECGERERGEEAHSARTPLLLDVKPPVRLGTSGKAVQDLRLINFTVDDWSLDKGTSETLTELAEFLDPAVRGERDVTALDCWQLLSATVFGFADCHEEPSLGARRAERVKERFALSPILIETPTQPMTKRQLTEGARRLNRSVLIKLELELADRVDFSGSVLDDLLARVEPRRAKLLAGGARKALIDLAALLTGDPDPENPGHQLLNRAGAIALSGRRIQDGDCEDPSTYDWRSARKELATKLASTTVVPEDFCGDGDLPALDDVIQALDDGVLEPMERGIKALLRLGGWNYGGSLTGCACLGFRELRRRSRVAGDIYSVLDEDDPVWEDTHPPLRNCYP
jgi:hypothetical protein